jgi:hypothetical protein
MFPCSRLDAISSPFSWLATSPILWCQPYYTIMYIKMSHTAAVKQHNWYRHFSFNFYRQINTLNQCTKYIATRLPKMEDSVHDPEIFTEITNWEEEEYDNLRWQFATGFGIIMMHIKLKQQTVKSSWFRILWLHIAKFVSVLLLVHGI